MNELEKSNVDKIYDEILVLINNAKNKIAKTVNYDLINLYWQIGNTIRNEILNVQKAEYGKNIIKEISKKLTLDYGRGFSKTNVYRMIQINEYFNDYEIFSTVSGKLSWSHWVELLQITDEIKRKFYITMSINENWSVRVLRDRIDSALFDRTVISKKPEQTIINDLELLANEHKMTTDLFFRDPYILDFLNLKDTYSEKDLESAIINELEKFILEMGNDFAFLSRQKRITIDGQDFYMDLLFYHRKLKRLVVIELKLEKFKPEHKGQVELYLKWLDKYEKTEGENSPIAIILCATKSESMAELLELDNSGIHVAQYLTQYVPKELLEKKFLDSIENARTQMEQRKDLDS